MKCEIPRVLHNNVFARITARKSPSLRPILQRAVFIIVYTIRVFLTLLYGRSVGRSVDGLVSLLACTWPGSTRLRTVAEELR
jgi:hypothetical protein